jgi:hypothetical protein
MIVNRNPAECVNQLTGGVNFGEISTSLSVDMVEQGSD